ERKKVAIEEQQGKLLVNAEGGDDDVSCFSYRDALLSQGSVIVSTLLGHAFAKHFVLVQSRKRPFGLPVVSVVSEALKYLQENQVSKGYRPVDNSQVKSFCVLTVAAVEIVDPDAGINQNHSLPLISSRSPSHFSLPRSSLIFCCLLLRTSSLSACSTASFLVPYPDALRASAISL